MQLQAKAFISCVQKRIHFSLHFTNMFTCSPLIKMCLSLFLLFQLLLPRHASKPVRGLSRQYIFLKCLINFVKVQIFEVGTLLLTHLGRHKKAVIFLLKPAEFLSSTTFSPSQLNNVLSGCCYWLLSGSVCVGEDPFSLANLACRIAPFLFHF